MYFFCGLNAGEVGESTVGFGHTVAVFFLFESGTGFVVGIDNFELEAFGIRHSRAVASGLDEPRKGKVKLAMAGDWERDLVVCATNTARFNFEIWTNIRNCFFEDFDWVFATKLFCCAFDCGVDCAFSGLFFAVKD